MKKAARMTKDEPTPFAAVAVALLLLVSPAHARINVVTEMRQELGLSIEQLSAAMGVAPTLVRNWEADSVPIPSWVPARLAYLQTLSDGGEGVPDAEREAGGFD